MKTFAPVLVTLFALLATGQRGYSLAIEHVGPDPRAVAQPGWPQGIVQLVRHPSRVYSLDVNGNENFYFQASPEEINQLLELLAKSRMRDHEIRLEPGAGNVKSLKGDDHEYNVSLHVLGGIVLAMTRLTSTNLQETLEPVLTVYVGEDRSLLRQLKLPENAILQSHLEGAEVKGGVARPTRQAWYGCVQWDDSTPAVDLEHGLSTRITLWEDGFPDGIQLFTLGPEGSFSAGFSEQEMSRLKSGKSWLTVTVGNWATQASKDDPRYPPESLTAARENAKPLKLPRPSYYHGRVLFEDGSPPVFDPPPWPGAEVWVDFSFAGPARLDREGYFKLFFTPDQFAQLKSRKPSKNIYCPLQDQGRSAAQDTFPAELLSLDKAKAGVVRIRKPILKPVFDLAKAPSLLGKALPALAGLGLPPAPDATTDAAVLLCFFDLQQRPSRNCVVQLAKDAQDLKLGGLAVVAIQAAALDPPTLAGFVQAQRLPFPVGKLETDEEKIRFNWGVRSLPWLVLADKTHTVRAEGFPLAELKDRLAQVASGGR